MDTIELANQDDNTRESQEVDVWPFKKKRATRLWENRDMITNLAVLLDENLQRDGEIQIKRKRRLGGFGSEWELTLWVAQAGAEYPRRLLRVTGSTPLAMLDAFATKLAELEEQARPVRIPAYPVAVDL